MFRRFFLQRSFAQIRAKSFSEGLPILTGSTELLSQRGLHCSTQFKMNGNQFGNILPSTVRSLATAPGVQPFASRPQSLEIPDNDKDLLNELPGYLRLAFRMAGYYTKESRRMRAAQSLYREITAQATNEDMYKALGLAPEFRETFALLTVHVWVVLARLRKEGDEGSKISQAMYDIFWVDMEARVHDAGVKVRVSKWLKELEEHFYGSCVAYDKGIEAGNVEFQESLYRNVYAGEGDKKKAGILARYLRRELASLSMTSSDAICGGSIRFTRDY